MTLKDALARNDGIGPGFHFLRHALAITILFVHCRGALNGMAPRLVGAAEHVAATQAGAAGQGSLAAELLRPFLYALLAMFFALSGFLVTGSAIRTGKVRVFLANRALRIFPALAVEVTLSAIVLGPIVTTLALSAYYTDPQFWRYFGNIVGAVTFYLPGVFEHLPWPGVVNGNLWTLAPEFYCYLISALAMGIGLVGRPKIASALIVLAVIGITIANVVAPATFNLTQGGGHYPPSYITIMFFIGALFFFNADRIPLSFPLFVACAVAFHLSLFFRILPGLSGVALSYCMVYLGMMRFPWFERILKSDYSYGIYLYGFPMMQMTVWLLLPYIADWNMVLKLPLVFAIALTVTFVFAAVSWRFIEKPALSLRRFLVPKKAVIPPAAA